MFASLAQLKAMSPIHVLRGLQLAFLGTIRAIQNPNLYKAQHAKLLFLAAVVGLSSKILVQLPLLLVQAVAMTLGAADKGSPTWTEDIVRSLEFVQHWVIQLPFVLLNIFRNSDPTPFDQLFLQSVSHVDAIHDFKHRSDAPQAKSKTYRHYLEPLKGYEPKYRNTLYSYFGRRAILGLVVYFASFVPKVGWLVIPSVSFYSLYNAIGLIPASISFTAMILVLPRHYSVVLLQTYLSTRALTRQLLQPYFARVGHAFNSYQKGKWYREREGVLFGFSLPFFFLMRVPYVGVLFSAMASASAAFLISKITSPPPEEKSHLTEYVEKELVWTKGRRNLVEAGISKAHLTVNEI